MFLEGLAVATAITGVAGVCYWLWRKVRDILHPPQRSKQYIPLPSQLPQLPKADPDSSRNSSNGTQSDEKEDKDAERREKQEQNTQQQRKEALVRQVAQTNQDLGKKLMQCAGVARGEYLDSNDAQLVTEVARRIGELELLIVSLASRVSLDIDVDKRSNRVAVNYPTSDIEPQTMTDIAQFPDMLPEQLMADDDDFYRSIVLNEALVLQAFESVVIDKILYTLLDVSGSMKELLESGLPRHIVARGIMVKLLYRAINGGAKYYHRDFDGEPHQLLLALTPEEAERLCDIILHGGLTQGGTNILKALQRAVEDIRQRQAGIQEAEVLLISDGDDEGIGSPEQLEALLGDDIRLHVALVGKHSEILKAVAHTYIHFP
ncbi:MAG: hypothetical protein AAB400_00655 [Patescibacteria group bacterium]